MLTIPTKNLEAKFTALDLKPDIETGLFEGYAALFNREDLGRDLIIPGAFTRSLTERGPAQVRMLFQHNPSEPIGVWDSLREDARGLYVRGRLTLENARAREVHALMRSGAIDGLSIGFNVKRAERDKTSGARRIRILDLWEISVVTFPMMPEARIGAVKSKPFKTPPTPRQFERWLTHDAGFTRSEARALITHGLKGLSATQDAGHQSQTADRAALLARIASATERVRTTTHIH